MKSISSLATILLLIFACRMCNFTGSKSTPEPSSSPTSGSYPSDSPTSKSYPSYYIKEQLGTFRLIKSYNKEETRKTASGFTLKFIDQSVDTATGEYKSSDVQDVVLMVASYSTTTLPASLVDEIETAMRADPAWKTMKVIPTQVGKRVEGVDGRGHSLVVWNTGYWVFMTAGSSPSDASSLADSVVYD